MVIGTAVPIEKSVSVLTFEKTGKPDEVARFEPGISFWEIKYVGCSS